MISYARRKTGPASNCQFQVGTAEALAFPAEHFDVVVSSLVMHHLPEDLRMAAFGEMRRVLRPGGKLLVAEARNPSHGLGWRLLARVHGYDRMARLVPHLEQVPAQAGFGQIRTGEARPWLRYVSAVKTASAGEALGMAAASDLQDARPLCLALTRHLRRQQRSTWPDGVADSARPGGCRRRHATQATNVAASCYAIDLKLARQRCLS